MRLARITWPRCREYFRENDTVLIGVGSIESHGLHNPLGTDTMAPDRILDLVEEQEPGVLIAPTVPYGATDDLVGFPGTVSLGVQGLVDVLTSITEGLYAYGARRFVFINGHGGNVKSISEVCLRLNARGCLACNMNWWLMAHQMNPEKWRGGHGDGMETSANLAIDPDSVDLSAYAPEGLRDDLDGLKTTGWYSVEFEGVNVDFPRPLVRMASNGWVGEGRERSLAESSAETGRAMLQATADYVVRFVRHLRTMALPDPLDYQAELDRGLSHIANLDKQ